MKHDANTRGIDYKKIGILISVLVVIAIMVSIFVPDATKDEKQSISGESKRVETDSISIYDEEPEKEYLLRVMNDKLIISKISSEEYEETNINMNDLPVIEQERIKAGDYHVDEAALYDFLESYTS